MGDQDIWTWLDSCRQCEEPHQWRWTCPHPPLHPVHRGNSYYKICKGGTWAHPDDGHPYQRRLAAHLLEPLKREYEAKHLLTGQEV